MLRVRVLGELALEVDGVAVELPSGRRARMLLAWLALRPGPQPRAALAGRLWPDTLDESARTSLRNAVWGLRRTLGPRADEWLIATRDTLELATRDDVWVDARAFAACTAAGRLEEAAELAAGEPISGIDAEWVYDVRDAHREALGEILEGLARAAQERGDTSDAVRWSRRRAALDPLSEEPARALMRRLAAAGDRAGALAAFERLAERLRTELRVVPSPATRDLADELRGGRGELQSAPPLPARLAAAPRAPFVGRERELAELREAWRLASAGPARLALVCGEPGIGKTRLAAELARERHADGAAVLYGSADEHALVPYQPFAEALRGRWPALPVRSDTERLAMFEAVARTLESLAASWPILLVLDDLHWADPPSVQLLRYVCRATAGCALLVVALFREAELGQAAAAALADLRRELPATELSLRGLAPAEVAAIAEAAGRPAAVGANLHADTDGNPFFVHEILRALEDGAPISPPPERVRELIRRRVAHLGERPAEVLAAAALLGREFEVRALERLLEVSPDHLAEALDDAARVGLIEEVPDRPGRCEFAHALVREALYADLGPRRRALLHRRAGAALQALYGGDPRAPAAEIAHHLCAGAAAGGAQEAVAWALRAAEQARSRVLYEEAIDFYTRALDLLPPEDPERRRVVGMRAVAYQALTHLAIDVPPALSGRTAPG